MAKLAGNSCIWFYFNLPLTIPAETVRARGAFIRRGPMKRELVLAFLGGLIVASGITYFSIRRPVSAHVASPSPPAIAAKASALPPLVGTLPNEEKPTPAPSHPRRAFTGSADRVRTPADRVRMPVDEEQSPSAETAPAVAASVPDVQPVSPPPVPQPAPHAASPHSVTLARGTLLTVRLNETVSTQHAHPGDPFTATLDQPLAAGGFVIAERGARVTGKVVEAEQAGRVRGVSRLGLELTELSTADGQRVRINTATFLRRGESSKVTDMAKVGIGSVVGATIGAIAGGLKGAGLGAGFGGAAGAGDVLLTRGRRAEIPVETRLSFALSSPITLTEQFR